MSQPQPPTPPEQPSGDRPGADRSGTDQFGAVPNRLDGGGGNADTDNNVRELSNVPSVEVISRAAVMLMSSTAEKLGLSEDDPESAPGRDLDEARRLITALAGLVSASVEYLGPHAAPIRDGLQSLQRAFREASADPDPPGQGPGEKYTGPVR